MAKIKRKVKATSKKGCTEENTSSKTEKYKKKQTKLKRTKKKKHNVKKYTFEDIKLALAAIDKGQSIREASENFGVPKSTLFAKLKSFSEIGCKMGPATVLTQSEEDEIVKWILYCAERGFPITKTDLLNSVQKFLIESKRENPFKNNRPGRHCYMAFMRRHNNLSKRIAQNLTCTRASVTEANLKRWFAYVEEYLKKKDLLSIDANRVFNLDESAFMLVPKDNTVITEKGSKSVYQVVAGNEKACLTVLFVVSASGDMSPPMILYDLKTTPKKKVLKNIPTGWAVGNTERGWMTAESFYAFIVNVFVKWIQENNIQLPIVLYVDGHKSHITLPLMKFCQENQIEIVALYPNSTHIIQPLDVAVFHPLKEAYKTTLRQWRVDNNIINFQKFMFPKVLELTLDNIDLSNSIRNGFKACGLFPFDPQAVNYNILNKKKKSQKVVPSTDETEKSYTDSYKHLEFFEENVLPSNLVEEFKKHDINEPWDGDIKYEELFNSWAKMKKLCDNIRDDPANKIVEISDSPDSIMSSEVSERNIPSTSISKIGNSIPHIDLTNIYEVDEEKQTVGFDGDNQYIEFDGKNQNVEFDGENQNVGLEERIFSNIDTNGTKSSSTVIDITSNIDDIGEKSSLPGKEIELFDDCGNRMIATVIAVIPEEYPERTCDTIPSTIDDPLEKSNLSRINSDTPENALQKTDEYLNNEQVNLVENNNLNDILDESNASTNCKNNEFSNEKLNNTTVPEVSLNDSCSINNDFTKNKVSPSEKNNTYVPEVTVNYNSNINNNKDAINENDNEGLHANDKDLNLNSFEGILDLSMTNSAESDVSQASTAENVQDGIKESHSLSNQPIKRKCADSNLISEDNAVDLQNCFNSEPSTPVVTECDSVISPNFKTAFALPNFNIKKAKKNKSQNVPPVSVVDDFIDILEKKEKEKKLKEQQVLKNKQNRENMRNIKQLEQNAKKVFQENKKKLLDDKRNINSDIKQLKKNMKSEKNKENLTELIEKQKILTEKLEEVERLLIDHEMQALQRKRKIKQEIV